MGRLPIMKAQRNSKKSVRRRQKRLLRHSGKSRCFIYALKGEAGTIRYVGQTRQTLQCRLAFHMKSASPTGSPIQRWLVDNKPEIVMLDEAGVWDVDEVLWIERLRLAGELLLNVSRGGRDCGHKAVA